MKKTLLIAAAALAAGIISTQASSVYSQNIVGYANLVINGGGAYTQVVNPFSTTTNDVEQLITLQGGETVYIWHDTGYYVYVFQQGAVGGGFPSDWTDGGGVTIPGNLGDGGTGGAFTFVPAPQMTPGQAVFINEGAPTFTNTISGNVITSNTNSPTPINGGGAYTQFGSVVPVGGDLETNSVVGLPLNGGETVYIWHNTGYYVYQFQQGAVGGGFPSDWTDGGGVTIPNHLGDGGTGGAFTFVPNPQITVGGAVFYNNPGGATHYTNNIVIP